MLPDLLGSDAAHGCSWVAVGDELRLSSTAASTAMQVNALNAVPVSVYCLVEALRDEGMRSTSDRHTAKTAQGGEGWCMQWQSRQRQRWTRSA